MRTHAHVHTNKSIHISILHTLRERETEQIQYYIGQSYLPIPVTST